jgi:hypothetical protein
MLLFCTDGMDKQHMLKKAMHAVCFTCSGHCLTFQQLEGCLRSRHTTFQVRPVRILPVCAIHHLPCRGKCQGCLACCTALTAQEPFAGRTSASRKHVSHLDTECRALTTEARLTLDGHVTAHLVQRVQ